MADQQQTIVKEAFLDWRWWLRGMWYQGNVGRVPAEAHYHRLLANHPSIVRYLGYGVYKPLRMVRIYTAYCSKGDGNDILNNHRRFARTLVASGQTLHAYLPAVVL
jgi:hypothetical protein